MVALLTTSMQDKKPWWLHTWQFRSSGSHRISASVRIWEQQHGCNGVNTRKNDDYSTLVSALCMTHGGPDCICTGLQTTCDKQYCTILHCDTSAYIKLQNKPHLAVFWQPIHWQGDWYAYVVSIPAKQRGACSGTLASTSDSSD